VFVGCQTLYVQTRGCVRRVLDTLRGGRRMLSASGHEAQVWVTQDEHRKAADGLVHFTKVSKYGCHHTLRTRSRGYVYTHIYIHIYIYIYMHVDTHTHTHTQRRAYQGMGWLQLVGFLTLQVSFGKDPNERDDILQKRFIVLGSLLIVATP